LLFVFERGKRDPQRLTKGCSSGEKGGDLQGKMVNAHVTGPGNRVYKRKKNATWKRLSQPSEGKKKKYEGFPQTIGRGSRSSRNPPKEGGVSWRRKKRALILEEKRNGATLLRVEGEKYFPDEDHIGKCVERAAAFHLS